ncbi:MAG: glycosyltransferase family 4 protein, partial [Acidobacteriota bacterium]|nr:glycosyltransferase family 4 protein [Acidobacteriota bacterium]
MLSHGLGSYYRARGYAQHLVERGYRVEVVTVSERNRVRPIVEEIRGVRIIHSPDLLWGRLRTGWDPWDCAWRILGLLRHPVDLIKCYDTRPVSVIPAFALKRLLRVPVVMSWGDWWGRGGTTAERSTGFSYRLEQLFSPVETFFEESFHRHADGLIVLSEALRNRAIGLGVPASKIRIIVPGVDSERVRPGERTAAREALGIAQDCFLYGYAGGLFPRDGELLLEAHRRVSAQVPNATAVLIGHSRYQPAAGTAVNLIRTGGKLSYEKVLQWFAACDVMLLPLCDSIANRGRWPSKVAEYMAAERPVVATAVGDLARLFEDGRAGVLTAANPESFAEGILRLHADPNRKEMGRAGREIACKQLLWTVQTNYVQEFLEQVYE